MSFLDFIEVKAITDMGNSSDFFDLELLLHNVKDLGSNEKMFEKCMELSTENGLFLEFGVASGESIRCLSKLKPHVTFHGFDSFQGLPEAWHGNSIGTFKCDVPTVPDNVKLHIGMFEETLPKFIEEYQDNVAFINIDCDLYSSTKTVFKYLGSRIVPGTILRFDEIYGYKEWKDNEYKAFREFLEDTKYRFEIHGKCSEAIIFKIIRKE
jgi:hypothetical protein